MRTTTYTVSDDLTLTADQWGDPDGPPVLMLHGAGQNRHAWKGTAARLADEGWFAVTVDARGHGDSDWSPSQSYDVEHSAADTAALLESFDRPVVAVGASMGGMSCLEAQRTADRQLFRAVVLVDITPSFDMGGARRVMEFMTGNPDGFASLEDAADAMAAHNPNRPRPKDLSGLTKVLVHKDDGRWHWRWDPAWITSKPGAVDGDEEAMTRRMVDMRAKITTGAEALTVPVLLVRGSQSDLVTPEAVRSFQESVPHADFVDVAGTGHMVAGDDNDAFTAAVLDFLRRIA